MASEGKILKKASARQANSNEGTVPVTAPDECRGVAAATSTRVGGDRCPTTVFPEGCTVLQGVLGGNSDGGQSKTKRECASVQLPPEETPKYVNGAKDIPEVPRMYLSKVRGVDIIGRFEIEVRPLGEVDPEDFECIVSSMIGTIQRTVPEREREPYHYDLLKTLDKDDFDTKYDGAMAKFSLRNHLEADLEGFGTKSEAWARKIIDLFIKASHESKGFLEICLARGQRHCKGQADQFPCIIRKGDERLQLTGRVDYMLTHFLKADNGLSSTTLSRSSSMDRVVPLMRPYTNILLIEAKRMDPKENIVSRNLPQILAQAHLSMSKTGREDMPWVLSNGDRWVFGISHAKGNDWGCVHFEPRPLFGDILCRTEPQKYQETTLSTRSRRATNEKRRKLKSGELDAIMGRAKAVVRILTVWCCARPGDLWTTMCDFEQNRPPSILELIRTGADISSALSFITSRYLSLVDSPL